MKKPKKYKKCPRCSNKCLIAQEQCDDCGLIFSRMEFATNKAAKKKLLHFDKDYVIYTCNLPKDVKWWKLLLYAFLLGLFGGHYYYVGKYIKGGLMSAGFVYLLFCTFFNGQIFSDPSMSDATTYLFIPIGIYAFAWIVSLVYVCCKKFKVPVYIDMNLERNEKEREEFEKLRKEIRAEKEKIKKEEKLAKKSEKTDDLKDKTVVENEKLEDVSAEKTSRRTGKISTSYGTKKTNKRKKK